MGVPGVLPKARQAGCLAQWHVSCACHVCQQVNGPLAIPCGRGRCYTGRRFCGFAPRSWVRFPGHGCSFGCSISKALYQQMWFWDSTCCVGQTHQHGLRGDEVRHSFGHTGASRFPTAALTSMVRRRCWLRFKHGFCQCNLALTGVLGIGDKQ